MKKKSSIIAYTIYYALFIGGGVYAILNTQWELQLFLWIYLIFLLSLVMASNHLASTGQSSRSYYVDRLNADMGPYQIFPLRRFALFSIPAVVVLVLSYVLM